MQTLYDVVHTQKKGQAALVSPLPGGDSDQFSYSQMSEEVSKVSQFLAQNGVKPGDYVLLVLGNSSEFAIAWLAITCMRAIAAPLNPLLKAEQIEFTINDTNAKFAFLSPDEKANAEARKACSKLSLTTWSVRLNPQRKERGFQGPRVEISPLSQPIKYAPGPTPSPPSPADNCLFLHTSGTTGRPKGVPLNHGNLLRTMFNIKGSYDLTEKDVVLVVMPLFHVHGLIGCLLSTLYTGGTCVIQPGRFAASTFWDHLTNYKCTWYSSVPTIHQILLQRAHKEKRSTPALRFIRSCSAALAPPTLKDLENTFGVPVIEAYAMTEASHQMTANALPPGKRKPGSVGKGRGVAVCIKDMEGKTLKQGEKGEVCVKGPNVMKGYLNNPEANKKNFTQDGWFRTGDQGFLDEDQYVHLTGRLKEMINRGGEKITPNEIDNVLLSHPSVSIAVTFGVPDAKYGEEVNAAIVLHEKEKPNAAKIEKELKAICLQKMASFAVPKKYFFTDDVPRTATGKVQRRVVSAHFQGPKAKL